MIKGAKFYKCDFQVHTPRDINFSGKNCTTDDERAEYSKAFIRACREKNLDAVAITDHHDLAFYPYIKHAAENELDSNGNLVSREQRVIIFPGIELTLGVPCQAIVIFDAFMEMSHTLQVQIYQALGVPTFNPSHEAKNAEVERLQIHHINEVFERLDSVEAVKGKYLLLPNIKRNGEYTIFRTGLANQYKDGKFIAGYLDGNIYEAQSADLGWLNKITGKTPQYGNRAIAVFQTSDNRTETFENLGNGHTWIKFLEPTAEGLRQACLARVSRVSQNKPKLPTVYIERIQVFDSTFLRTVDLYLNPQLNVLIGGRGTGKSTVLRYMMYALGAGDEQIKDFISGTLPNGYVVLTVIQNGVVNLIKRSKTEHLLKVGDRDYEPTDSEIIKKFIQVDAYAQKELSQHKNNRVKLVNRLISFSIESELEIVEGKVQENHRQIEERFLRYQTILSNRKRERELQQLKTSLEQQIAELEKTLIGQESDQKIIERQNNVELEKKHIENLNSIYNSAFAKVASFIDSQDFDIPNLNFSPVNNDELAIVRDFVSQELANLKTQLLEVLNLKKTEELAQVSEIVTNLDNILTTEYNEAKMRMDGSQDALIKIERFRDELKNYNDELDDLLKSFEENKNIERELYRLFRERFSLSNERFTLKRVEASRLSTRSEGGLEIELIDHTDTSDIARSFADRVRAARNIQEKSTTYFASLSDRGSAKLLRRLLKLWTTLFRCKIDESVDVKEALSRSGLLPNNFTDNDFNKIKESLGENDLLQLSLMLPSYKPNLFYYINNTDKISFNNASDGQQAGAILQILLNQTHGSLLIDQPEDDLDNKVIHQITERICDTKENRQLIFSSHNANIAVNGDAELIIHLDHNTDKSAGEAKIIGTIDCESVRNSIKDVMEGGETAFHLRAKKYNFTY